MALSPYVSSAAFLRRVCPPASHFRCPCHRLAICWLTNALVLAILTFGITWFFVSLLMLLSSARRPLNWMQRSAEVGPCGD